MEEPAGMAAVVRNPGPAPVLPQSGVEAGARRPVFAGPGLRAEGGDALAFRSMTHDARNLVTALRLCSDGLAEPGVLAEANRHFAAETRSVADALDRLTRRLGTLAVAAQRRERGFSMENAIADLPAAVRQLNGLLSAVVGPAVGVELACLPCRGMVRLSEEDLTRILLHLVRNAADAMPAGGQIRLTVQRADSRFFWALHENDVASGTADLWDDAGPAPNVALIVEDDGPGIPEEWLERVFEPGFSTRRAARPWPQAPHHGLGLSLVRELVEQAGGAVRAVAPARRGTRIEIVLPLTNVMASLPSVPTASDAREDQGCED